uniref:ADAM metallopeptidase domain 32 n=1 Tax=Buteo japonicus TaxID=224669 RepID=A0A8C0HKT9_9AVES
MPFFCSVFLSEDFKIYMPDEKGSLRSDLTPIKGGCHYRGYVEGFPSSAVTLSTCSGLRGLLQFENVSYGIEPLGYSPAFEHFVYRVSDERTAGSLLASSHPESGVSTSFYFIVVNALSALMSSWVIFQYNYMGSDTNAATRKIIQVFNLVNNMFNPLNVTVVLSSLELWTEENKISTAGEADDLLQRFLQWKQSHLTLGSYDIAYLLLSLKPPGGILLGEEHPGEHKVHVVTQVPQRWSQGIGDMSLDSVRRGCASGGKDGEKSPFCLLCQFKQKNSPCRPAADAQCDLAEFCNGSSASCPPDLYDGHGCEHGTGYCYKGRCQSPDLQCRRLYGRGSKNAPVACYEELNSQRDRFGHCGFQPRQGYKSCAWRNLRCGKLICTYPYSTPFPSEAAAVLYVQVREHLCISLDYLNAPARLDPLLVPPGTKCGSGKVRKHFIVCNNKRHCHCHPGWKPPDCLRKGSGPGGSVDSGLQLMDH